MRDMMASMAVAVTMLGAAPAMAQISPATPEEIAGVMAESRAWRLVSDAGWQKTYFGPQQGSSGATKRFLTADLNNEPQQDMLASDPASTLTWGAVIDREYVCAGERTRIFKTLTLYTNGFALDQAVGTWVPRSEVFGDGQAMFDLACPG